jgi:hypothetical protein
MPIPPITPSSGPRPRRNARSTNSTAPAIRILPLRWFAALAVCGCLSVVSPAAESSVAPGTELESLVVGPTTYRNVRIRSINARSVMITHERGMSSIKLRDLSPEWQERFGYDPAAETAVSEPAQPVKPAPVNRPSRIVRSTAKSGFDQLLRQQGQPAEVKAEVDHRPKFFQLELHVKNQGRRPSCAIFAVVSALEFQDAELSGTPQKFSEEYLSWATLKTVKRVLPAPPPGAATNDDSARWTEDADLGFTLHEVVAALRGYGIPLQSSMPNRFGRSIASIEEPPAEIIEEARSHQRVFVHEVTGRDNFTRINNLVHALNAGIPVPVGMAWPYFRTVHNGYINTQDPIPFSGHAVTLVGYRSPTGKIEDVVFIFKNSWGPNWGQGGYGLVTYRYLVRNLHSAVLLEVQRG